MQPCVRVGAANSTPAAARHGGWHRLQRVAGLVSKALVCSALAAAFRLLRRLSRELELESNEREATEQRLRRLLAQHQEVFDFETSTARQERQYIKHDLQTQKLQLSHTIQEQVMRLDHAIQEQGMELGHSIHKQRHQQEQQLQQSDQQTRSRILVLEGAMARAVQDVEEQRRQQQSLMGLLQQQREHLDRELALAREERQRVEQALQEHVLQALKEERQRCHQLEQELLKARLELTKANPSRANGRDGSGKDLLATNGGGASANGGSSAAEEGHKEPSSGAQGAGTRPRHEVPPQQS